MEGDFREVNEIDGQRDFYPRPHMEGDDAVQRPLSGFADFYPRPHMEGDRDNCIAIRD